MNSPLDLLPPALRSPVVAVRKLSTRRKSKFSKQDDLLLLREVCAAKAHISPNAETKEQFEIVAVKANQTQNILFELIWKSAQHRHKCLQARFNTQDRTEELMSGVGGEQGGMEELL